ncbi:MAG TPA: hypothetical protein VFP81_11255, partial [Propionibacteriaceae bacterium]|nr:hypothetical protein [Propionibacteriaceae bacterium]
SAAPRRSEASSVRLVGVLAVSSQPHPAGSDCLANVCKTAIVSLLTDRYSRAQRDMFRPGAAWTGGWQKGSSCVL